MMMFGIGIPFSMYIGYHLVGAYGTMHNHKCGANAYGFGLQHIMYPLKSQTAVWRPEIDLKE